MPSPPPAANPLTRRRLLQVGGVVGGALAVGAALLMRGGGSAWYQSLSAGAKPRVLSEKAFGVLHAFCEAVVGAPGEGHLTTAQARLAERIDRELQFHFPRLARDLELALMVVEHGGLKHLSPTRFSRLDAEGRERALERLATGSEPERQAFAGLKLLAVYFFYCDDRSWKDIHYEGPLVQVRKPPAADSNPLAKGA